MRGAVEEPTDTVQRLIQSCQQAQEGFMLAAEAAEDFTLKRLFNIYAHQRSRFAEELKDYGGFSSRDGHFSTASGDWTLSAQSSDRELLQSCLEADEQILQVYREAVQKQIPRKAHFLVSAQLSLMQRVHERMHGMLREETSKPLGRVSVTMERAVV